MGGKGIGFKLFLIIMMVTLPAFTNDAVVDGVKIPVTLQAGDKSMVLNGVYSAAPETIDYLKTRILNQPVRYDDLGRDRHNAIIAHVVLGSDNLQLTMVKDGMAMAYPFAKDEAQFARLLEVEEQARQMRAGLWGSNQFRVLPADRKIPPGVFQIIESKVDNISKGKGVIYINFGRDYRSDFTLFTAPKDMVSFRKNNIDVMALTGKTIRVRGWIYERNGPAMDLTTPLQIEVLN